MTLDELLAKAPAMHPDAAGRPVAMEASVEVLRTIDREVGEGSRTLETGGGLSTLVFAMKGAVHDCVVPFADEVEYIRSPLLHQPYVVRRSGAGGLSRLARKGVKAVDIARRGGVGALVRRIRDGAR